MKQPDYQTIKQKMIQIADEEILPRFEQTKVNYKADGSAITETDLAVQNRVQKFLEQFTPDIPLLGEEMSVSEQQQLIDNNPDGLWCLDPLDGTSNYGSGLPFFALSIALLQQNRAVFGIVYDPIRQECFMAIEGQGAWLNEQRLNCNQSERPLKKCLAVVDFKRLTSPLQQALIEAPPYASQRSLGSVALDWCWLAANRYQVYLHGKQKAWDYAAGCLILREAGGIAATLDGQPVDDGSLKPRSATAACTETLFDQWQQFLQHHSA